MDLDFVLLEIFGARYLPNDIACRIAARRESARALADYAEADDRATARRLALQPPPLETLIEVG